MSREFTLQNSYTGDGVLTQFAFDFKVTALDQILVIVLDDTGVETERVRGDDTVYLSTAEFDDQNGGGSITLAAALTAAYTIYIQLADDEPSQDQELRDKFSLNTRTIENAYDRLMGAIQRVVFRASRSIRLHDTFDNGVLDAENFDMQLPINTTDFPDGIITINSTADGFEIGSTVAEILDAAVEASLEAVTAGTNDSAEFAITEGQAATDLTGMTINSATYKAVYYIYTIVRGTTVFSSGWLRFHYRNGTWYCLQSDDDRDDSAVAHGVTFSFTGTSTAQIQAAVASDGAGNGTIDLKQFSVLA